MHRATVLPYYSCLAIFNHLNSANPCSPSVPFFCSSFTSIALIFLPCSPLVLFVFLLPSRSPSSIEPCQSFFLVPLPSSFFHLFPFPAPFFVLCGFFSGPAVPCTSKKDMHSGFVPFSSRSRSGRVSVSFPFRSGRVPFSFPFRSGRVSFSFPFRSGHVPFSFPFR